MPSSPRQGFEAPADLADAIRARSKALKHKFSSVDVESGCDDEFDPPMKTLTVTLRERISVKSTTIRLIFWQDRWVWIDARAGSKKGWDWSFTCQGRLKGGDGGDDLLQFIEQFHQLLPGRNSCLDHEAASNFWEKLLLTGPRGAR